tara:strand:- start:58 stop:192 length:135 start_codon:yes stop_codon:yes gene_type:complete
VTPVFYVLLGIAIGLLIYDMFIVPIHPRFAKYLSGKVLINDDDK